jgi:hypothetical protein
MGHGQGYEETDSSRGLVGLDLTPRHPDSSLLCLHHVVTLGHEGHRCVLGSGDHVPRVSLLPTATIDGE